MNEHRCLECLHNSCTASEVDWNPMQRSCSIVRWVEGGPQLEWSPLALSPQPTLGFSEKELIHLLRILRKKSTTRWTVHQRKRHTCKASVSGYGAPIGAGRTDFHVPRRIQTYPSARGSALAWEGCKEIGGRGHRFDGGRPKPSKGHLPVRGLNLRHQLRSDCRLRWIVRLKVQTEGRDQRKRDREATEADEHGGELSVRPETTFASSETDDFLMGIGIDTGC